MIRWHLEPHMLRKGWGTAYRLAAETGISRPAAMRVLSGVPLERIDVGLLETLSRAFKVRPWALLDWTPE